MRKSRKIVMLIMAAAAATAVTGTAAVSSGPAARASVTKELLKNQAPSPLCASANGTNLARVYGKACDSSSAQQLFDDPTDTDVCPGSGTVTSNCPFPSGSGLNTLYSGKRITYLINDHFSTIVTDVFGDPSLVEQNVSFDSGADQAWVIDGNLENGTAFLISPDNSTANNVYVLCSNGQDNALREVDNGSSGACVWHMQ